MTANILSLTDSIIAAAKGRGKVAKEFAELARPTIGEPELQKQLADTLNSIRRELNVKRDADVTYLKQRGEDTAADTFVKQCLNTFGYAVTVAGKTAGCKFQWDNTNSTYVRRELAVPAAPTAKGKDANSAEQSAALVAAAEAAPVLAASDKQGHLMGVLSQLLKAGYTLGEIEAAWHGMATKVAADQVAAEVAATATVPQAKVIATLPKPVNGMQVKAPRKAKPAANKPAAKSA